MYRDLVGWYKYYIIDFATIAAALFIAIVSRKESYIGVTSLYKIDCFINKKRSAEEKKRTPLDEQEL
jgi:hypothetical protein